MRSGHIAQLVIDNKHTWAVAPQSLRVSMARESDALIALTWPDSPRAKLAGRLEAETQFRSPLGLQQQKTTWSSTPPASSRKLLKTKTRDIFSLRLSQENEAQVRDVSRHLQGSDWRVDAVEALSIELAPPVPSKSKTASDEFALLCFTKTINTLHGHR